MSKTKRSTSPQHINLRRAFKRRPSIRWLITPQKPVRRLLGGLIVGALVGGLLASLQWLAADPQWLEALERIQIGLQDDLYTSRPTASITTIIAIDDPSLAMYGRSTTEWSRSVHTELVDTLTESGARVIVFDVLFAEATEDDAALAEAMIAARNVVQPVVGYNKEVKPKTWSGDLIAYDTTIYPTPELMDAARVLGHGNVVPDGDGQVRQVPLITIHDDQPVPALALAAYSQYLRFPIDLIEIESGAVTFANRTLYTDSIGQMLISYFGPPSNAYRPSTYPVYSYVDVIEGRVPPNAFTDKIVLIGALDATGLPDSYATPSTPTGAKMFGIEIHANIIETIHQSLDTVPGVPHRAKVGIDLGPFSLTTYEGTIQYPLRAQPLNKKIAITAGMALLAGILLPFLRWYVGLPLMLFGYWVYYNWAVISFQIHGRVVELLFPGLALGFAYMGTLIVTYIFEERRRGQINDLFSRYVSAEIAQKIVEAFDRGQLELGGEEREITVLFADVRGFTTLSEGLDPPEVVQILNIFLEQMTGIVMDHGGAINKYIGDNLMAFWNAPYPQDDHAWQATQAGLEILAAIEVLNTTASLPAPVQFGIGINTGPVVVGNIGSARRLEYTPIGDTVNVASRLCGVVEGGSCFIGARTWDLLDNRIAAVDVHHLKVKGKAESLEIYELKPGANPLTASIAGESDRTDLESMMDGE